jgi:hypothetical protein
MRDEGKTRDSYFIPHPSSLIPSERRTQKKVAKRRSIKRH